MIDIETWRPWKAKEKAKKFKVCFKLIKLLGTFSLLYDNKSRPRTVYFNLLKAKKVKCWISMLKHSTRLRCLLNSLKLDNYSHSVVLFGDLVNRILFLSFVALMSNFLHRIFSSLEVKTSTFCWLGEHNSLPARHFCASSTSLYIETSAFSLD